MRRLVALLTLATVAITAPSTAHAQTASVAPSSAPPTAGDPHTIANEAFQRGLVLTQREAFLDALAAFQEAYRLYPTAAVLYNVAYCQRALGEYVTALATFEDFLSRDLTGVAATRREEAEQFARELRARLAHIVVALPAAQRVGTEVLLDGRPLEIGASGEANATVNPGRHTLTARRDGYRPLFDDRRVPDGATVRIDVQLQPMPAHVRVTANVAHAAVRIDGHGVGFSPYDADIDPGPRNLEVIARGYIAHRAALNLLPGQNARVAAQLSAEPIAIYRRWWFWSALGVVVTGVVVGTYALTRPAPPPPPYNCGSTGWCVQQP
jgi:hypothetical protein